MSFSSGEVVAVDFPSVIGIKRRPAVVCPIFSDVSRDRTDVPDVIVRLITSQEKGLGVTAYVP